MMKCPVCGKVMQETVVGPEVEHGDCRVIVRVEKGWRETLSPELALFELKKFDNSGFGDQKVLHSDTDDILCSVLLHLGFVELVKAYEAVPKWYA